MATEEPRDPAMTQQAWQVTGNVYQTISGKIEELPLPPATIRAMLNDMWKMVAAHHFELRDWRAERQADKDRDRADREWRQWLLNGWLGALTIAVLILAFGLFVLAQQL